MEALQHQLIEGSTSGGNVQGNMNNPAEADCSICFELCCPKAFTDPCIHPFCYTCILQWSKVRPVCPICRTIYTCIIYNVRDDQTYDTYPVAQSARAASSVENQLVLQDVESSRTTVSNVAAEDPFLLVQQQIQRQRQLTEEVREQAITRTCEVCGEVLQSPNAMFLHTRIHERRQEINKIRTLKIEYWNLQKTVREREREIEEIRRQEWPCEVCGRIFCSAIERARHWRTEREMHIEINVSNVIITESNNEVGEEVISEGVTPERDNLENIANINPSVDDANCTICLEQCCPKAFTDPCIHPFCYTCILQWSKVRPICPLCRRNFTCIIHNVRDDQTYDTYPVLQSVRAASSVATQLVLQDFESPRAPVTNVEAEDPFPQVREQIQRQRQLTEEIRQQAVTRTCTVCGEVYESPTALFFHTRIHERTQEIFGLGRIRSESLDFTYPN